MKKVVLTLIVALSAYVMQAASVTWLANNIAPDPDGGAYTSYMAYLIDATEVSQADMITALKEGDTSKIAGATMLSTATKQQGTLEKAMFSVSDSTVFSSGDYTLYTLILNNSTMSDATYYMITPETDFAVKATGTTSLSFNSQVNNSWQAVAPEPTSGLLLLVGGALLALRRKQK